MTSSAPGGYYGLSIFHAGTIGHHRPNAHVASRSLRRPRRLLDRHGGVTRTTSAFLFNEALKELLIF